MDETQQDTGADGDADDSLQAARSLVAVSYQLRQLSTRIHQHGGALSARVLELHRESERIVARIAARDR